ncbi:MAG: class I SAM-dependent methyltransferase [Candidatus Marinimicrobia bacterium]|nr:class I SAM-dependent methyltransferase [Candidatus Neomarinimicrobiota bacterium]
MILKPVRIRKKNVGKFCRTFSISHKWGLLLFKFIREYRPRTCLELGTALGISTAYIASACEINKRGKVITIEGSKSLMFKALENLRAIELNKRVKPINGQFDDVL